MIAIKLLFYSLLFLFLAAMVGGPWFALAAYVALWVVGVTDTVRKARQLAHARAEATKRAKEARITNKLTDDGIALFTCPN
jgi:hypothetical protein